jgi:hypothetical protein
LDFFLLLPYCRHAAEHLTSVFLTTAMRRGGPITVQTVVALPAKVVRGTALMSRVEVAATVVRVVMQVLNPVAAWTIQVVRLLLRGQRAVIPR